MTARRVLAALVLAATALVATACGGEKREERVATAPLGADEAATYEYLVPYGTSIQLESGQPIDIMPSRLDVKVGESIRITNDDIRDYMIGVFFVKAGQSLAMRFTHEGTLTGTCEMNPEGQFEIVVTD